MSTFIITNLSFDILVEITRRIRLSDMVYWRNAHEKFYEAYLFLFPLNNVPFHLKMLTTKNQKIQYIVSESKYLRAYTDSTDNVGHSMIQWLAREQLIDAFVPSTSKKVCIAACYFVFLHWNLDDALIKQFKEKSTLVTDENGTSFLYFFYIYEKMKKEYGLCPPVTRKEFCKAYGPKEK